MNRRVLDEGYEQEPGRSLLEGRLCLKSCWVRLEECYSFRADLQEVTVGTQRTGHWRVFSLGHDQRDLLTNFLQCLPLRFFRHLEPEPVPDL